MKNCKTLSSCFEDWPAPQMNIRSSPQARLPHAKPQMVICYIAGAACALGNAKLSQSPRVVMPRYYLSGRVPSQNSVSTCLLHMRRYGLVFRFRQRTSTFSLQEELKQGVVRRHQIQGAFAFGVLGLDVCSEVHEQAGQLPIGRPRHGMQRGLQVSAQVHICS